MANTLKTEEYIVAFIDMLGAKKLMERDSDGLLNIAHDVYTISLGIFKEHFSKISEDVNIRIYSDNITFFAKCTELKATTAFMATAIMSAIIQVEFLIRGIIVRGGIAKGDFFYDNIMVWGNALSKSYTIEDKVAIYPRIVIDKDLFEFINKERLTDDMLNNHVHRFITKFEDEFYFVNFFNEIENLAGPNAKNNFLKNAYYKKEEYKKDEHVLEKWLWLIRYLENNINNENK